MKTIEINVFIAIIILLTGFFANKSIPADSTDSNPSVTETQTSEIDPEEMFEIQRNASKANQQLYESFEWVEDDYIYPDDFAGTFIDFDTLHVLVTDKAAIEKYSKLLSNYSKSVTFDVVKYSYNELYSLNEKCVKDLQDNNFSVTGYYVDVEKNKGVIEILSKEYDKASAYAASHFDSDMIEIEKGEYAVLT